MIAVINLLYFIIILFFLFSAFFISYHIVKYSLSKTEMLASLAVFLAVFTVLIFSNLALFSSIRMDRVISLIDN